MLWIKTYGSGSDDWGASVMPTSDEGFIVAGTRDSDGRKGGDIWLMKTDPNGDTLWTRTYGGKKADFGESVDQTSDGGYIIGGYTHSFGAGDTDAYLVKTDGSGAPLWSKTYGGKRGDGAHEAKETSDGGYVIVGWTGSSGSGGNDVYLVKTDVEGNPLWEKTYGKKGNEEGFSVEEAPDGGYLLVGHQESDKSYSDLYLVRTDEAGEVLWTTTYGAGRNDVGRSVCRTREGGYAVTGETYSYVSGNFDIYLLVVGADGDTLWTETYDQALNEYAESIQQTSDGGYIVAGRTESPDGNVSDLYMVKTDGEGNLLWIEKLGGLHARSVCQIPDGGYIVTGRASGAEPGNYDLFLMKRKP
jgi:hypothetical protein